MTDERRRNILSSIVRRGFVSLWACVSVILLLAGHAHAAGEAAPASNSTRVVRAHGNDDRYWLIQVEDVTGEKGPKKEGRIYRRARGDEFWLPVGTLDTDVAALGSR